MTSSIRTRWWKAALMCIVISMFGTVAVAQEIGTTTAVTVLTTGQPPGAAVRRLKIGTNIFANERLVTSQSGRAQLIFNDRSSLIVAPNSDLVLDEYVYDPKTKAGKVIFSTTKGFFRFVGGVISKKNKVEFRTPLAIIALRGGIADVNVSDKSVVAIKHFGVDVAVTPRTPDGAELQSRILRNGFKATVTEKTGSVQLEKVTQAEIDGNLSKLEGEVADKPDESEQQVADAGSSQDPADLAPVESDIQESIVDNRVPESDIAEDAQETVPQSTYFGQYQRNPVQNFTNATSSVIPLIPAHNIRYGSGPIEDGWFTATLNGRLIRLPVSGTGDFTFGSAGTSSPFGPVSGSGFFSSNEDFFFYVLRETEHSNNLATIFGGIPITSDLFPTSGFETYRYQTVYPFPTVAGGDVLGLLREYTLFSIFGYRDFVSVPGVNGGAAVVFDGSGPSQRSAMIGTSGSYSFQRLVPGGPREGPIELRGGTRTSTRRTSTGHPVRAGANFYSVYDENRNSLFGSDAPDFFAISSQDTSDSNGIRRPGGTGFYQSLTGDTSTAEVQGRFHTNGFVQPSSSPTDLGSRRTTRTLSGYTGGIVEIRERGGIFQGDYVFNADPDDRGRATIPGVPPSRQTGIRIATDVDSNWMLVEMAIESLEGPNNNFYRLGTPIGTGFSRSAFIDDRRFIVRELSPGARDATGNGFMSGDPIIRLSGSFVTAGMIGDVLPDGFTPCECEFLSWGYWSADARRETTIEDRNNDREATHIASWVAGEIPDAVDIPTTGTASYAGHIVGNVKNGANYYVSAGRFTQQYNFATDTGAFNVTNFDGADYSGSVSASNLRNDFQGTDIQGSSNRVMNLRGSFFKTPSQGAGAIPAYVGGDFNVTGDGYKAGGTFAGER